ncbi:restriction endonuclease subunit S [Providencia sp. Je.9.19]|uniref:restriction endonuclease subunit S n=1 Tax=Providencia sp. Je.9.19 TaxID=3142844 RepID=UPI003DA94785
MAGSYKQYQGYISSGVDWIGEVPSHWSVKRLKHIFDIKKRIAGRLGFDVLSITQRGIIVKDIESGDGQLSMDYSKYQLVFEGDFAMNHMDLLTGYVDISCFDGVTSPDYRVFTLKNYKRFNARYYLYLLQMCYRQKIFFPLGQGSAHLGRWRLPTEAFNDVVYPYPSFLEQQKIASFLDHEIAKIDTLIAKQEKLIELLQEKRQAVISHVVTKGLNPDVPMKDSGVEWLGKVPEHWGVTRAKFVSDIFVPQRNKPELNSDNIGISWATMDDMKSDFISSTQYSVSKKAFESAASKVLPKDSVIASCVGNFGIASINKIDVIINQQLQAYIPSGISPLYLRELISVSKCYFELVGTAATLVYVNQQGFENLPITLPSTEEQQGITNYLTVQKGKLDKLIDRCFNLIELFRERKTALISAAVTGKIDVRDWVIPDEAQREP